MSEIKQKNVQLNDIQWIVNKLKSILKFIRTSLVCTGRNSEVERLLMVRWIVGTILHGVDPLSNFSFQPVLHDWCNKGHGMCYPVCGMVHIKEPLLLIDVAAAGFLSRYQNGP